MAEMLSPSRTFVARVPSLEDRELTLPIQVREFKLVSPSLYDRCSRWQFDVGRQIRQDQSRADRDWDWAWIIPSLTFGAGLGRQPRIFELTIGWEARPVALISLLSTESWLKDPKMPSTFLWWLSAAPKEFLTFRHQDANLTATMIGRVAFDVAVTVALRGPAEGRLWLHADPKGGRRLFDWYRRTLKMELASVEQHPKIPGARIRGGRPNDGRYFYLEKKGAEESYNELSQYRR